MASTRSRRRGRPVCKMVSLQSSSVHTLLTGIGSAVGSIFGLIANGFLCDIFGYKKVMVFALTLMTLFIFVPFFAPNIIVLEVGQCLCGIPWGIFQTLGKVLRIFDEI
jgi:MFS family permease